MPEEITIPGTSNKTELYESLLPQVKALVEGERSQIANMANVAAVLKEAFGFLWVGFYLVENDLTPEGTKSSAKQQLVLGPFQGPVACTRIDFGKGVCGSVWESGKALIVPDVDKYPGHIACSAKSRSEIVLPLIRGGKVTAVLDIDSVKLGHFDSVDQRFLEAILTLL